MKSVSGKCIIAAFLLCLTCVTAASTSTSKSTSKASSTSLSKTTTKATSTSTKSTTSAASTTTSSFSCPTGRFVLVASDSINSPYNYSASILRQQMTPSYLTLTSNNPAPATFDLRVFNPPVLNSSPVCALHDVASDTYATGSTCPTWSGDPNDSNSQRGPYRVYFTSPAGAGTLSCTKSTAGQTIFCGCGSADRWYLELAQYVNIGTSYQPARNFVGLTLKVNAVQ